MVNYLARFSIYSAGFCRLGVYHFSARNGVSATKIAKSHCYKIERAFKNGVRVKLNEVLDRSNGRSSFREYDDHLNLEEMVA